MCRKLYWMLELSLSRTFAPRNALGNENTMELSLPGMKTWWKRAKKSWNFHCQSETHRYNLIIYVRNRDKETRMHSELAIEMGSEKFLIDGMLTLRSRQTFEKVCLLCNHQHQPSKSVSSCMIYSKPTFVVVGSVKDPIQLSLCFFRWCSSKTPKVSVVSNHIGVKFCTIVPRVNTHRLTRVGFLILIR